MKKILIVSQVIPQWYVNVLTNALGEDSEIDIITGSKINGNVIFSPKHDPRNLLTRIFCWAKHYLFMIKWIDKNKKKHYDLIFAISNPPINSKIGLLLKKCFHSPFVYMNWDLYPQVIVSTFKNPIVGVLCAYWEKWNKVNYPKIDKILTVGSVMSMSIMSKSNSDFNVKIVPIAVDTKFLEPLAKIDNSFCIDNGLVDKFIVLYSGKMGLGHNIELILETAEILENNDDILFVFIGDGPKYKIVEFKSKKKELTNIKLFPHQNELNFPKSIACGDIGIVSLESRVAHLIMPSKTYSMMACGEAIIGICTENDDLHELIVKNNIGEAVTDYKASTLAECIFSMYLDKKKLNEYKMNARSLALKEYDYPIIEKHYKDIFSDLLTL